jgi:hypothetical protein
MNKEVEILKIGSILPVMPIKGTRVYDTAQFRNKQTIMVVYDGGELFDYYVNKLRENCGEKYSFQKTAQSIVGYSNSFRSSTTSLKGISDGDPQIGQSYTINKSSWYTSTVIKIIDGVVLITKNSVYAIHNISDLREDKLKGIGI